MPNMDCFASRAMKKLNKYMSLNPDPDCYATNALYQDWEKFYPYLFPPFCLIGRVLKKVQTQKVQKAILVAPLWTSQPWFPRLLQMVIADPLLLPSSNSLLKNHLDQPHPLIKLRNLKLAAFLISSEDWRQEEYRDKLQPSYSNLNATVRRRLTHRLGKAGVCGVNNGKWIPLTVL